MRVFWPTTGLGTNRGSAIGWTTGDAVIIIAVVDKVDKNTLKQLKGSPPLKVVATVVPAADAVDAAADSESTTEPSNGHKDTASSPKKAVSPAAAPLTIWVDTKRPCAYSSSAETVLFRPPGPLERLTLGEAPTKNGVDGKKDDDLGPIIDLLNRVSGEQDRLYPPNAAKAKRKQYFGWARNIFTTYRMSGTFRNQGKLGRGLTPAGLVAPGVEYTTKTRTLPTIRLGAATLGGYSFGKDASYDAPTPFMIAHNAFTLYMFWSQIHLFAAIFLPYAKPVYTAFCKVMAGLAAVLSYQVTVLGYTTSLRRSSAFLNQVAYRAERLVEIETDLRAELAGKPLPNRFFHVRKAIHTDMAGGFLISAILAAYPLPAISASLLTDPIIAGLNWLNEWPVGLKLNTPLSEYLSSAFSTALVAWRYNVAPVLVRAQEPATAAVLLACLLGLSFGFALIADFISLLTLHIRLCYFVIAQVSSWQMSALKSLWDLYRGKRWNVLRQRTDSHAYDLDTLFLGTLLFTVVTFLAPTALAYAALFSLLNFAIVAVVRLLELAAGALDTLPVHELESRVIKPGRIPAGVVFDQLRTTTTVVNDDKAQPPRYTLLLKSTPKSIPTIVVDWFHAAVRAANP